MRILGYQFQLRIFVARIFFSPFRIAILKVFCNFFDFQVMVLPVVTIWAEFCKSRLFAVVVTYNSAIAVCQRRGNWTDALQLLNSMCHVQLLPDVAVQTKGVGGQKPGPVVPNWSRSDAYCKSSLF